LADARTLGGEIHMSRAFTYQYRRQPLMRRTSYFNPTGDFFLGRFAPEARTASNMSGLVQNVLRSPSRVLDVTVRDEMGSRFGYDFSRVRIHADAEAAQSAHALHALAYTFGRDIVFGANQYAPKTSEGRQLLAHELTHVVQQAPVADSAMPSLISVRGNDQHEQAAKVVANRFCSNGSLHISNGYISGGIQRAEEKSDQTEDTCAKQENDPESFSIQAAKHFLTEVDPTASQLAKTVHCEVSPADPERVECDVFFSDGQKIHVTWIKNLNNVEAQRTTPDGRQWCVYHYVCDPSGSVTYEKKGCSSNVKSKPSSSAGPTLVGSGAGVNGHGDQG
jgi:hypothetical protein